MATIAPRWIAIQTRCIATRNMVPYSGGAPARSGEGAARERRTEANEGTRCGLPSCASARCARTRDALADADGARAGRGPLVGSAPRDGRARDAGKRSRARREGGPWLVARCGERVDSKQCGRRTGPARDIGGPGPFTGIRGGEAHTPARGHCHHLGSRPLLRRRAGLSRRFALTESFPASALVAPGTTPGPWRVRTPAAHHSRAR